MRGKNNKGFTLIEVIAVIVLLGILSVMVVPKVYDLFTNSRKTIYIEDAIRLISQAQYTMNSKSMKIEKPDNGECIVFSMKYLSINDFQNPPNGGTYLSESSFVLVKNVNGNYIYSTMIVERTKDDVYMGVELTTEKALNEDDAIKHVRTFKLSEIGYFDDGEWNEGSLIDSSFISGNVKTGEGESANDWNIDDEDIIGYYNNERGEDAAVVDTATPKIFVKFSTSGALETVLTITAKDDDTDLNKLKVCIKVSENENDSYPSASDTSACEEYGSNNVYEKNINFADYGFSYANRSTAYVYILVVDDTNNYARKKVSYDVHENEPPVIKKFSVTKLASDKHNMPRAGVKLELSDDMTNIDQLQICFVQDNEEADTCSPYASYASLFGSSGVYQYTFKNSSGANITVPDGSGHSLRVFVKDEKGLVTTADEGYLIYDNKSPTATFGDFTTSCLFNTNGRCSCKTSNCNSLTVGVNLTVDDDVTDPDDLVLKFYQLKSDGTTRVGEVTMTYSQFKSGDRKYTFSGGYDGKNRELFVDVRDEFGKSITVSKELEDVYEDLPPSIVRLKDDENNTLPFITSAEYACSGADSCKNLDNGGSYLVNLNFEVMDDLTSTDDIKVCVSENSEYCENTTANKSHFISYSSFDRKYEFSTDLPEDKKYPNDQVTKSLYVALLDSKGNYTTYDSYNPVEYKVYHNAAPIVTGGYEIVSSDEDARPSVDESGNAVEGYEGGLPKVVININSLEVVDDFVNYTARFCYSVDGEENICTPYDDLSKLKDDVSSEFLFKDESGNLLLHDGQTITTRIDIKDNYGSVTPTSELVYNIYKDKEPEIVSSSVKSVTEDYNSYYINVAFKVLDYQDDYQVCITDEDSCSEDKYIGNSAGSSVICDEENEEDCDSQAEETTGEELFEGTFGTEYELTINGNEEFEWSDKYQNEDPHKHLKLFVKDTYGNVKSVALKNNGSTTYDLYELCSLPDYRAETDEPPTFEFESGTEINPNNCSGACYRNYKTTDNTTHVNYHTGSTENDDGPIVGNYKKTLIYEDTLVGLRCNAMAENTPLRCDNVRCFNTGEDENPNVISLKLEDEDNKWYYSNSRVTKSTKISKPYCENVDEDNYFHPDDIRCENVDDICSSKASEICKPFIEQYEQEVAAYEVAESEFIAQQLIADHSNKTDDINTCKPLLSRLGDNEWLGAMGLYCINISNCESCKAGGTPFGVDCTTYEVDGEIVCENDDYHLNICTALGSLDTCNDLYDDYSADFTRYKTAFESDPANVYPTQNSCYTDQQSACTAKYDFCNKPFTEVYKDVPCDADNDLEVTCRKSDFYDGFCLETDNTCTEEDADCVDVCYKHYDCKDEYITRPVTFTCNGYFPTYKSIHDDDNNIILQKTPIRVCPEFYFGFFDQIYAYDNDSTTPYVRFNPDEIEIHPDLVSTSGEEEGDDGD